MVGHEGFLFGACAVVWLGIGVLVGAWMKAQRRLEQRLDVLEAEFEAEPLHRRNV